jgi:hypothetical protein
LEFQTEENKGGFKDFDNEIKRRLNEDDYPTDGDKASPEEWAQYVSSDYYDEDFQKEFGFVVNDENIPEADEEFTPDVYDDTYLNMELALPRPDGKGREFAQVDEDGNQHVIIDEIIDHRKDSSAVALEDAFVTTSSGSK